MFLNESQNGSFKASLLMFDLYQQFDESLRSKKIIHWLELTDQYLYVVQLGFTHFANVFFSAALQKTVEAFTDTGIIQYLFERNYHIKRHYQPLKDVPNVLSFNDLSFGFNIWFGACCVSIIAFLAELLMLMWTMNKWRILERHNSAKWINYQKVHPAPDDMHHQQVQSRYIKPETLRKFRVQMTDSISRTRFPAHQATLTNLTRKSKNGLQIIPLT